MYPELIENLLSTGNIVLPLLVLCALLSIPFTRRIIFKSIVFIIGLVPAGVLLVLGFMALPFWKIALWLADKVLRIFPVDWFAEKILAMAGALSSSALAKGDRKAFALQRWPAAKFPYLYLDHIPADIRRPLYEDGRLLGGYDIAYLADRHFGRNALRQAIAVGMGASLLFITVLLILAVSSVFSQLHQAAGVMAGRPQLVLEQWPQQPPQAVPVWWWLSAVTGAVWQYLVYFVEQGVDFAFSSVLLLSGVFLLVCIAVLREWQTQKSAPYEMATKDALVRWPHRAESRDLCQAVYRRQVALATTYLKDKPTYLVGKGTGILHARGDLTAPVRDQDVRLDQESLFQHMLVLGGTGEGKTTAILRPLMRQLLSRKNFGLYVCDAKGVLWNDAQKIAKEVGRADDVVVIGTGAGQRGVEILASLTPTQVAATLRSVLKQMGSTGGESFWPDMAANLLRNILTVAQSYALTDEGRKSIKDGLHPYSLWWAYQAALNDEFLGAAIKQVREAANAHFEQISSAKSGEERLAALEAHARLYTPEATASIGYLETTWREMAKETRSGIVANVTQLLDGFSGSKVLRERFASGRSAEAMSLSAALEGKIVLNALSNIEEGLPARLVSIFVKTMLYREARVRESRFKALSPPKSPQDFPCVVMIDEVQEVVTADPESGLSDATFWNVARSAGLAGVFATQTIAAIKQALGPDAAGNFLQQTRSKVFFRSEDRETVEYACWCAGEFERGRVFEDGQRESLDYRNILDQWDPLAPVDPNESMATGPRLFFSMAGTLLQPEKALIVYAQRKPAYAPDLRFIAFKSRANSVQDQNAVLSSMQQATWRAEDLERQYRSQGNEMRPALTPSDVIQMGRWHAYAHIQRAGAVRQDIIAVEHDLG